MKMVMEKIHKTFLTYLMNKMAQLQTTSNTAKICLIKLFFDWFRIHLQRQYQDPAMKALLRVVGYNDLLELLNLLNAAAFFQNFYMLFATWIIVKVINLLSLKAYRFQDVASFN